MPRSELPLGPGEAVVVEFARELRRLRQQAGGLTYRQLSARAHYSPAALSEAAGGRKLPSLSVTVAYVRACGGDTVAWEARWRRIAAQLAAADHADAGPDNDAPAPYVGLAAFQPEDADHFFGRDDVVADLVHRVADRRFLGVFGPSGCGKSSVLRAGLTARLMADQIPGYGPRPVVVLTPGAHPVEECAVRMATFTNESAAILRSEFAASPENLHLRVRQTLVDQSADVDLVLVVDQFEEVFTLCTDPQERLWLVDALVTAATAQTSRTRVVLGVRADFYGHCGRYPQLVNALRDTQVLVGPMTNDQLRLAITGPAARAGCSVETALVSQLVAEAAGQPAVLPLLSHALLEAWRRRQGSVLTVAGYDRTGGIQHALAQSAESVFTALEGNQRAIARQLFLRLTAFGEGTEDTKRRITRTELDNDNPDTTVVLTRLAQTRLITLDQDSVEIAHEALIRHWPRLRDWLTEDRDSLRIHRELTQATLAWEALNRDPEALYRGTRLARAHEWETTTDTMLTPRERKFLDASLTAQARERTTEQRHTRRLRRLIALLAILALVASITTTYALLTLDKVGKQNDLAVAEKVIIQADIINSSNPDLAAQLSLAAYRLAPTAETYNNLLRIAANRAPRAVDSVGFDTEGRLLGIAIDAHKIWLRDVTDYRSQDNGVALLEHHGVVDSISFSSNGHTVAIATGNERIQLWNITDPAHPVELATYVEPKPADGCQPDCFKLALSPDGRMLVTAGYHRPTRLWDISDPQQIKQLASIPAPKNSDTTSRTAVSSVSFSPNEHILAIGTRNLAVRLWDITDPQHPIKLPAIDEYAAIRSNPAISSMAASVGINVDDLNIDDLDAYANGHMNVDMEIKIANSVMYTPDISWLAFSPDGHTLVTARGYALKLWDVSDPLRPNPVSWVEGPTRDVTFVAFSPNGHTLAAASRDQTTQLWDITDINRPAPSGTLATSGVAHALTFAPDGLTLATTLPGQALAWDTNIDHIARTICATQQQITTAYDWNKYFPGLDYKPPCQ